MSDKTKDYEITNRSNSPRVSLTTSREGDGLIRWTIEGSDGFELASGAVSESSGGPRHHLTRVSELTKSDEVDICYGILITGGLDRAAVSYETAARRYRSEPGWNHAVASLKILLKSLPFIK